jgi:hypothetical protein
MGSVTTPSPLRVYRRPIHTPGATANEASSSGPRSKTEHQVLSSQDGRFPCEIRFSFEPYRNDDQLIHRNGRPGMDSKGRGQAGGGSTATVSRVVNGTCNVSCEARAKVLGAVSRLQYPPTVMRQNLGNPMRGSPGNVALLHRSRAAREQGDWQSLSENESAPERLGGGFEQDKNP